MNRETRLAKVSYAELDRLDPPKCTYRIEVDQLEALSEIRLFVQLPKPDRVSKADSPCFCRRHKSEVTNKEHHRPIDIFAPDSFDLKSQRIGYRVPEPIGEGQGTDRGAIIELDSGGVAQVNLTIFLRLNHRVNKGRASPRFVYSLVLPRRNQVGCRFSCCGKAVLCERANQCSLTRPGRAV